MDGTPVSRGEWGMGFRKSCAGPFIFEVMAPIVLFEKVWGVQLVFRFPGVIGLRVAFPFKEILESFVLPEVAMVSDGLHFVLRFSVDKVRWGSRKVRAVGICFDIRG
jgi:hypothetical protein